MAQDKIGLTDPFPLKSCAKCGQSADAGNAIGAYPVCPSDYAEWERQGQPDADIFVKGKG